jgi:hypothetical protein
VNVALLDESCCEMTRRMSFVTLAVSRFSAVEASSRKDVMMAENKAACGTDGYWKVPSSLI